MTVGSATASTVAASARHVMPVRAVRTAVEIDGGRCARLYQNLEFLPAEWPAAQVMRAAADRCVD